MTESTIGWFGVKEKHRSLAEKVRLISQINPSEQDANVTLNFYIALNIMIILIMIMKTIHNFNFKTGLPYDSKRDYCTCKRSMAFRKEKKESIRQTVEKGQSISPDATTSWLDDASVSNPLQHPHNTSRSPEQCWLLAFYFIYPKRKDKSLLSCWQWRLQLYMYSSSWKCWVVVIPLYVLTHTAYLITVHR